jgi:hypothetical protein
MPDALSTTAFTDFTRSVAMVHGSGASFEATLD